MASFRSPRKQTVFDWRKSNFFGVITILTLAFLYLPLIVLVIYAFNENRIVTVWTGFSFKWFEAIANNEGIRNSAYTSVLVATISTLCSTPVALAAALAFSRGGAFRGRQVTVGLIVMPLVVPEIVTAIMTLIFFSMLGLHFGILNLVIAHTVFCIPLAMLSMLARLNAMGTVLEDAARDLYGSEWRVFVRITLPLTAPSIVAGSILAFVMSLDNFLISFMVSGAEATTLPVYIYGMLRLGIKPDVNAISTMLLALSVILFLISYYLTRIGEESALSEKP